MAISYRSTFQFTEGNSALAMQASEQENHFLENMFSNHLQGLIRFLSRKVKNPEDAEDIAHNAFIRIQRLANSGDLENPKAYLYQTAANLAIDQMRREKLHQNYLQGENCDHLPPEESSQADNLSPERLLAAKQQLQSIENALNQLPTKCKQAFMLHRVKGLSYSDIAKDMGVSVSSVEKYILQALKHCRAANAEMS
ncbi:RNA polymerase sigma factor [Marinibactrum halimedae]|uniref:RNA polymerase sigma factor n=1 Tax=Marinibactrum halimedae TaxID=1444977 RepID=A0AA37T2D6_9GAMM|nr:RNA polymerase sigma factor [Marinibactrum halimedae]MCD9457390.1 RNA polymerase sigma factor [Marinibactrum halimedae]GLS25559.1 RNA polymerase sigma factor [Marinibactrum halimedae]